MPDLATHLFVYGTLMPGEGNHRLIEPYVRSARAATIQGELVDLFAYPGLIPGDGIVRGILLEINRDGLAVTDRLEGYHGSHSFYKRVEVVAQLVAGGSVSAWTYQLANPEKVAHHGRLVVSRTGGTPVYAWRADSPGALPTNDGGATRIRP